MVEEATEWAEGWVAMEAAWAWAAMEVAWVAAMEAAWEACLVHKPSAEVQWPTNKVFLDIKKMDNQDVQARTYLTSKSVYKKW